MTLADALEPMAYDVAFWMGGLEDPDYELDALGDLSIELCRKLRALAIIVLLVKADTDTYHHNLMRSAHARHRYLQRLRDAGVAHDHHQGIGRVDAVLDALAADQLELARQLGALAVTDWPFAGDYEDDHRYGEALQQLCAPLTDVAALTGAIDAYEHALAGRPEARPAVLRALAARDAAAFGSAFEALLDQREAALAQAIARAQFEEPVALAERSIYVEGLALLRLAGRLGFATEREYRFCPSIARRPMTRPFPGE